MRLDDHSSAVPRTLESLAVGEFVEQLVVFRSDDIEAFGKLIGDHAPAHFDDGWARSLGFDGRIVHGLLQSSRFSRLMGMHLPGPTSVIQTLTVDFLKPVYLDQPLVFRVTVATVSPAVRTIGLSLQTTGAESGETVARGKARCVLRDDAP